ncbi:MAG: hypothetical protein V4507_14945 [Verrucomicrobiota bacterium]
MMMSSRAGIYFWNTGRRFLVVFLSLNLMTFSHSAETSTPSASPGATLSNDTLLNLVFDDPSQIFRDRSEGPAPLTKDIIKGITNLSSGTGGKLILHMTIPPQPTSSETGGKIQFLNDPQVAPSPFLKLILEGKAAAKDLGVGVIPNGAESALSQIAETKEGQVFLDGGFDFFFRAFFVQDDYLRMYLSARCAQLSLHLGVSPFTSSFSFRIFSGGGPEESKAIDSGGDEGADRNRLSSRNIHSEKIEPGVLYHVGVWFQSNPDGMNTISLYVHPGSGPMASDTSIVAVVDCFKLAAPEVAKPSSNKKIAINLATTEFKQELDLASFRIFKKLPQNTFPGIDGKIE